VSHIVVKLLVERGADTVCQFDRPTAWTGEPHCHQNLTISSKYSIQIADSTKLFDIPNLYHTST